MDFEKAPAKINLALAVTGKRTDGYHLIESLVVFTEFGDVVTANPAARDSLEVTGPYASQLAGCNCDANLVERARQALRALLVSRGQKAPPVAMALAKNLPVASGIGGGSADAAASLRLLSRVWNVQLPDTEMTALCLSLGADVPMCLQSRPAMVRGIGEILENIRLTEPLNMVLANPGVAVSTPAIFKLLARAANAPLPRLPDIIDARSISHWVGSARNDLAGPAQAIAPEITNCVNALETSGADAVAMSGSGATCFGLFANFELAQRAADELLRRHPDWFVNATQTQG